MRIPIVIVGLTEPESQAVLRLLEAYARLVGAWRIANVDDLIAAEPRLALISGMDDLPRALALRSRLVEQGQIVPIVFGDSTSPDALKTALHAGCRELIHPARDLDLLLRIVIDLARQYTEEMEVAGHIISVLGSHGGVGTTTTALALAHLLALEPSRRVVYVDMDAAGGDVRAVLGLSGAASTRDLMLIPEETDAFRLRDAIDKVSGGFWVLTHPEETLHSEPMHDSDAHLLLSRLRRLFTHMVIDLGPVLHGAQRQVVVESTSVLLITEQQAEPLRVAIRRLGIIRELGVDDEHLHVVVNRYESDRRPALDELAAHLEKRPAATVCSDHERVRAANADGVAVTQFDPESQLSKDMVQVCLCIAGLVSLEAPAKKPWWKVW